MLSFKLAFRNLEVHKKSNLVIGLVITVVVWLLFLVLSFADGTVENIHQGLGGIFSPTSDITVVTQGYFQASRRKEVNLENYLIRNQAQIRQKLSQLPGVVLVYTPTPVIQMNLRYTSRKGDWKYSSSVLGLDPKSPVLQRLQFIDSSFKNGLWLHHSFREKFPVKPGENILVYGKDAFGQSVQQTLVFQGFFVPELDNPNLSWTSLVSLEDYKNLAGLYTDEVASFNLVLEDNLSYEGAFQNLSHLLEQWDLGVELKDNRAPSTSSAQIYSTIKLLMLIVSFLVIFVVSVGIMNVISVNLQERRREIGTYYCLGVERPFLTRMYLWEILLVNGAGALMGLLLGGLTLTLINGLNLTTTDPALQIVFGASRFRLAFSWETLFALLGGVVGLSLLVAQASLGKNLKVSPIEAVKVME